MRMRERRAAVLAKLYETYKRSGAGAGLIITEDLDEEMGFAPGDFRMVVQDLAGRGLVDDDPYGMDARLNATGIEAIEEPGSEENELVQEGRAIVQNVTVSGGHVQIGSHNQQTITYQTVLTRVADEIARSNEIPEADRRRWSATLKEIAAHPLTQTVLAAAAAVGAATLTK